MDWLLCLLLLIFPAAFTEVYLVTAVLSLYAIGKSKTKRRKERGEIPRREKLFLLGYAKRCKTGEHAAKRFCYVHLIYWAFLLAGLVLAVFSRIFPAVLPWFFGAVVCKLALLDAPICIYGFVMTKHGKHGGCVWRWEEK